MRHFLLLCPIVKTVLLSRFVANRYAEQRYDEALAKFTEAMNLISFREDLAYNIALCYYRQKEFTSALEYIIKIIQVLE